MALANVICNFLTLGVLENDFANFNLSFNNKIIIESNQLIKKVASIRCYRTEIIKIYKK